MENPILVNGRPVRGTVKVEQDWIDVTTMSEVDPDWSYRDSHGHEHRWWAGPDPLVPLRDPQLQTPVLPSLIYVYDCEYDEDCDEYQPGHYECRLCGDPVTPRSRPTVSRHLIPGLQRVSLEVEEPLPRGPVTVVIPTDPPQMAEGMVTDTTRRYRSSGQITGSAHIVATGPLREIA
jgi:hypothetical protein